MGPDKKSLRAELISQLRSALPDRDERSSLICTRVRSLPEWRRARTVALFASMPTEPDVGELVSAALIGEKRVVLPRISNGRLDWIRITAGEGRLRSPLFPRLEEPAGSEHIRPELLDLVLVPGLGFGPMGERLGRGGGYYDRALGELPSETFRVGVCFAFQLREHIPMELHDKRVHRVISD